MNTALNTPETAAMGESAGIMVGWTRASSEPSEAFGVDVLEVHRRAEGQRRQDLQLVRGVEPLEVQSGIGFRVAPGLRFLQDLREVASLVGHLREDVVACAV